MRLFIALPVPDELCRALSRRADPIRRELPKARWVRPETLHLTLVFLGNTDEELLPALHEELRPAFGAFEPFDLRLTGGGTFPDPQPGGRARPARVAWVGIDGGPQLEALQDRVVQAAQAAVGHEPDSRPFHPHLTLARCSAPWRRRAVERFLQHFPRGQKIAEPFTVTRGILFESELSPHGARHREVASYPLGSGPLPLEKAAVP